MLWHYTTMNCLSGIIRDGVIRPATAGVPGNERPIVWFSRRPTWEPTATKAIVRSGMIRRATLEEMGVLARIGVAPEVASFNWDQLRRQSGMRSGDARRLERAAIDQASFPGDWYGTFDPVPREKWLVIQTCHDAHWKPFGAAQRSVFAAFPVEREKRL